MQRLPQPPTMVRDARGTVEADLSAYVLSMLDEHLTALQSIRQRLRMGGTTDAGARRALAADSTALAACFAHRMSSALGLPASSSGQPPVRDTHGTDDGVA